MSRRRNLPLVQRSHPTRFVAGAGNLWHASAHKGSPLFRRRAPAPSTVYPEGSPGGSFPAVGKAPGDPSEPTEAHPISSNCIACGSWRNCLLALRPKARQACTPLQKGKARWGVPHRLRGAASLPGPAGEDVGFCADQFAADGDRRGLRDLMRRRPEDSTGMVANLVLPPLRMM